MITSPLAAPDAVLHGRSKPFITNLPGRDWQEYPRLGVFDQATIAGGRLRRIPLEKKSMANGNFPACLKVSLAFEGGWSKHKDDPGGATMKGVTIGTLRVFKPGATEADLRNISNADVERIYRAGYWNPIKGESLPYGVDLATCDYAINSGVGRASKELQVVAAVKRDGQIGNATLAAVRAMNGKSVIQKLCARRLSFVRGLKTFKTFGRGWSRRIAEVEAKGVAMWLTKGGVMTTSARKELDHESSVAKKTADRQSQGAGGVAAGSGGGLWAFDPGWLFIGLAVVAVVGTVAVLAWRGRVNKDRAEAYTVAAASL